jgi:hypothetical protein
MLQAAGGFGGSFSIAVVRAQVKASAFNFTSEIVVRFSLRTHVKRICQRSAESRGFLPQGSMLSYLPKIRQRCSEAATANQKRPIN